MINGNEIEKMNKIVRNLINTADSKTFRGKSTLRKMLNMGVKYYDTCSIPYIKTIDPIILKFFDVSKEYDNCFINVYEHSHGIGLHCDKDFGMDRNMDIISVSIGIKDNNIVLDPSVKLGWMKINGVKHIIFNRQKFTFDYDTPHSANTLIKNRKDASKDVDYRVNFTFRASIKETHDIVEDDEDEIIDEIINEDTMNYIYEITKKNKENKENKENINDVFKNEDLMKMIFRFQKKIVYNFDNIYNRKVVDSNLNRTKVKIGGLNIGDRFYEYNGRWSSNVYEIVKFTEKSVISSRVKLVIMHTEQNCKRLRRCSHKSLYYKYNDELCNNTKNKVKRKNSKVDFYKDKNIEIYEERKVERDIRPGYYCEDNLWYKNGSGVCAPYEWTEW